MSARARCAIVLAAGLGRRLRPLTDRVPKPLMHVGAQTLLDRALADVAALGLTGPEQVTVNAHHLADQIVAAVGDRGHLLVEPQLLGTAGTIAALEEWIGDRDAVICNGDAYRAGAPLTPLLAGWGGERTRLLVVADPTRADFDGKWRFAGASLLPARQVCELARRLTGTEQTPGLYEHVWRDAWRSGTLELCDYPGTFIDCGTPADYAAANRHARQQPPLPRA
ncbi:MAG: nucleotidyltransferase family protein [Mycobacteriales bacterium]